MDAGKLTDMETNRPNRQRFLIHATYLVRVLTMGTNERLHSKAQTNQIGNYAIALAETARNAEREVISTLLHIS